MSPKSSSSASDSGSAPARGDGARRRGRLSRPAFLATVLTLAIGAAALAIPQRMYAPESVRVPPAAVALRPDTLGEEVAWQRVIRYDDRDAVTGVTAGAAGPVIVTAHGAAGVDPATGEQTWSYTRPASLRRIGNPCERDGVPEPHTDASCYAVLTPDRSRLVLGYDAGPLGVLLVVLDTTTGEVAFEHMYAYRGGEDSRTSAGRHVDVHVTDRVLMVGEEVVSLEDGSRLATVPGRALPDVGFTNDCPRDDVELCERLEGPSRGGHATLILDLTCWRPDHDYDKNSTWCEARIAPDDDLTAIQTVAGVVPAESGGPEVIEGWVVRYADPDAAYAELSQSSREDVDASEGAAGRGLPLEAVNLDSVSGSEPAETVPLDGVGAVHSYRIRHPYRVLTAEGGPEKAERSAGDAAPDTAVEAFIVPSADGVYTAAELAGQTSGAAWLETLQVHRSKGEGVSVMRPDGEVVLHLNDYPAAANWLPTSGVGYILRAPGVTAVVDQHAIVESTGDASYELIITALR
ncbi:hypothetical protein [Actinomyces glycerinitolerans]|uniref:Uncharacterized protein n=1 Tax=Actinomyces glycerinitolerans TaxID=1892869 RepID=A0A1M4RY93_9ACTO|nr:hypothetical protein [Actinomyces glycerinitolerans]SHE24936.1 Hypothetical protein ACGLYG10_1148 [Actinomyces glycerinitolerans]